jgi:hypothetical protein
MTAVHNRFDQSAEQGKEQEMASGEIMNHSRQDQIRDQAEQRPGSRHPNVQNQKAEHENQSQSHGQDVVIPAVHGEQHHGRNEMNDADIIRAAYLFDEHPGFEIEKPREKGNQKRTGPGKIKELGQERTGVFRQSSRVIQESIEETGTEEKNRLLALIEKNRLNPKPEVEIKKNKENARYDKSIKTGFVLDIQNICNFLFVFGRVIVIPILRNGRLYFLKMDRLKI